MARTSPVSVSTPNAATRAFRSIRRRSTANSAPPVQEKSGARVDLDNPEFTVYVEILPKDTFFGFNKLPGAGGLPVGASGRLLSLISGGFDSPVAAYRMMQRGCRVIFVHFHSAPYQDKTSQDKVRELVKLLTRHQFQSRLYMVPFGEIQRQIVAAVARPLRVVLYRRMMLRIGERDRAQRKSPRPSHRGKSRPGRLADAGKHDGDSTGGHPADPAAARGHGQARDRRPSAPYRHLSRLPRSRIRTAANCSSRNTPRPRRDSTRSNPMNRSWM